MESSNDRLGRAGTLKRSFRPLFLSGCIVAAVAAVALATPGASSARTETCSHTGTAYIIWPRQHRDPLYGQNNPQPDGCWIPQDLYSSNGYNFLDCAVNPFPTIKISTYGTAPYAYTYDDTNPAHSNEDSVIKNSCLGSATTLSVEMEAPGSGCPSSPNFQDRNSGFSVSLYLREIYCSNDAARDSIACSITTNHSCIINAGADVPTAYGGPCGAGITTCRDQMNTDFSNACNTMTVDRSIGVYGDYALSYNDGGRDDAKLVASWINADLNQYCFYNLG